MLALLLDGNKTNDDGESKENGKKWYVYIKQQQLNNFERASRYFVHLLAVVARPLHETS